MKKSIKNNKKNILISVLIFLGGIIVGLIIGKYQKIADINFEVVNKKDGILLEYFQGEKSSVYLYNLEEVKLKNTSLDSYIKNYENDIDKVFESLISSLTLKTSLKDGGTNIYTTNDKSNLTVIKCKTLDGNTDLIFGPKDMDTTDAFEKGACGKKFFSEEVFERVYKLNNIKEIKEIEAEDKIIKLYELELSDDSGNIASSKVIFDSNFTLVIDDNKFAQNLKKEHLKILEEGKYYTFTFSNKYSELIKDNIIDIFENCRVTDIEKTKD